MDVLSVRLKLLREEKELMQKEVASILNITTSAYGFYEQGKRVPTPEVLSKLSDLFEVSVDYLLGKTDVRTYNTSLNEVNDKLENNGLKTLAAHFDEEEFTEDDLDDIENFIKFIVSKKKSNK